MKGQRNYRPKENKSLVYSLNAEILFQTHSLTLCEERRVPNSETSILWRHEGARTHPRDVNGDVLEHT